MKAAVRAQTLTISFGPGVFVGLLVRILGGGRADQRLVALLATRAARVVEVPKRVSHTFVLCAVHVLWKTVVRILDDIVSGRLVGG